MGSTLEQITYKATHDIILWAKESVPRSIGLIIVFTIVGIPLIEHLQDAVRKIDYIGGLRFLQEAFYSNTSLAERVLFCISFILIAGYFLLLRQQALFNKVIEKFDKGLDKWIVPSASSWSIQKSETDFGSMLKVVKSDLPGTLKALFGWYDYKIAFEAKISANQDLSSSISFVIRSENNLNGLVFRFHTNMFTPLFLNDGRYIRDDSNERKLPSNIPFNEWVPVKVNVKGNNVTINISNFSLNYMIPTYSLRVQSSKLYDFHPTLSSLQTSAEVVVNEQNEQFRMWKVANGITDTTLKEKAMNEWTEYYKSMSPTTSLSIEYQRGSIGFVETSNSPTLYRNISIVKLS